jgi:hypothetical protein
MKSDVPWIRGWTPGVFGYVADSEVACIDHPFPGAKVYECVTSCWRCNSSAQDNSRTVVAAPLTGYHRKVGRRLYRMHVRRRELIREESRRLAQENP